MTRGSSRERGPNGRFLGWDGAECDEAGHRFYELRESGFTGWIDQDGHQAACPMCGDMSCTRVGFAGACNGGGS